MALARDHIVPLGSPGASDNIENIQPLCAACNSWKGRRAIDFRPAGGGLAEQRAAYSYAFGSRAAVSAHSP